MSDLFVAPTFGEVTRRFDVRLSAAGFDVGGVTPSLGWTLVDLDWSLGLLGTEKQDGVTYSTVKHYKSLYIKTGHDLKKNILAVIFSTPKF